MSLSTMRTMFGKSAIQTSKHSLKPCFPYYSQRCAFHQLTRHTTRSITRTQLNHHSHTQSINQRHMSAISRIGDNFKSNRPLQIYIVVSIVIAGGVYMYKKFVQANEQEQVVINEVINQIIESNFPQLMHQLDRDQVVVTKGAKLSGTVEANLADMWFDVRIAKKGAAQPNTPLTNQSGTPANTQPILPPADEMLALYKAHIKAHRDAKPLVTSVSIQPATEKPVEQATHRPWHIDHLTLSSLLKGVSYQYDPNTKAFTRCDEFIPVTAAPSSPTKNIEQPKGSGWVTAQRVAFGLMVVLTAVTGSLAFYRWQYRNRVHKHLGALVENALKNTLQADAMQAAKKPLAIVPIQPSVKELSTKIKPGIASGEYEAEIGGKTALISVQAVRDIKAGLEVSQQWKLLFASMRTKDGKTRQLNVK